MYHLTTQSLSLGDIDSIHRCLGFHLNVKSNRHIGWEWCDHRKQYSLRCKELGRKPKFQSDWPKLYAGLTSAEFNWPVVAYTNNDNVGLKPWTLIQGELHGYASASRAEMDVIFEVFTYFGILTFCDQRVLSKLPTN